MGKPVWTQAFNAPIPSADLNTLQAQSFFLLAGNGNNYLNTAPVLPPGVDAREIEGAVSVTNNGAPLVLDSSLDWSDRILTVFYQDLGDLSRYPGKTNDDVFNGTTAVTLVRGYTGLGAYNSASGQVASAAAPAVSPGTSWAISFASGLYLYADPLSTPAFSLCLYNETGSTVTAPSLMILATAKTGKR